MWSMNGRESFLAGRRFSNTGRPLSGMKHPHVPAASLFRRLVIWLTLGTVLFLCHFALSGSEAHKGTFLTETQEHPAPQGFFSGVNYREFGVNDVVTVAPEKKSIVYIYERNIDTGSAQWADMMTSANSEWKKVECKKLRSENSMRVALDTFDSDIFMACSTRRMSIPRGQEVRFISSFNMERDIVMSAFMEENRLSADKVDKNATSYVDFRKKFKILRSLDYMGYTNSYEEEFQKEQCPMSNHTQALVSSAVNDTFLPVSLDLPCISTKLMDLLLGLEITHDVKAKAHIGQEQEDFDPELSCVDDELTYRFTTKLLKMYDGSDLTKIADWRGEARRSERECAGIVLPPQLR